MENAPIDITSMNYPSDYPNDYTQVWFVSAPSGLRVRVHFIDFDLEQEADYLTVGTGHNPLDKAATLIRYSGDFIPDDVITPTAEVWFSMRTDSRRDSDGFKMELQAAFTGTISRVLSTLILFKFTTMEQGETKRKEQN